MQRLEPATESIVVTDGGGSVDICVNITWAAHTVAPKYTQGLKNGILTRWIFLLLDLLCTITALHKA